MKKLIVLAVLLMIRSDQIQSPGTACTLVAGLGCGNLIVDRTQRSDFLTDPDTEKHFAEQGMTFTFDANGVLDSIVAGSNRFVTDTGISPGDTEERVRQIYGKPQKSGKMTLYKGKNEPIGTVGDRGLTYPGILFVIVHGKV